MSGLSWDTVARVDKLATELALGDRSELLEGLRWIGVDEVSRTGGHVYFTIVTNLETGRVVWIGNGKGEAVLAQFFDLLGKRGCRKIRGVVSDLDGGYLRAIADRIPHALHVLDRFHIVKWLNEALNDVRRRVFGGAPTGDQGRTLKVKKWMLLSAYETLEFRQKRLLSTLVRLNRPLYRCYLLKERLRALLHYRWTYLGALRRNLWDWCHAAIRSRIAEIKAVPRRLIPHIDKVVAAFCAPIRMGLVEAVNGKIVVLRREGRGYRNMEYFKMKIFQRCSLPDNPWAASVL